MLIQTSNSVFAITDLHTAIINNDLANIKKIIKNTPSEIEKISDFKRNDGIEINGASALSLAILLKNRSIVEILLKKGADFNKKFTLVLQSTQMLHATPLHLAVHDSNLPIVALLLDKKANLNAIAQINTKEITPVYLGFCSILIKASHDNAASILKLLIWNGALLPKNINLLNQGTQPVSKFLLEKGMPFESIKRELDNLKNKKNMLP